MHRTDEPCPRCDSKTIKCGVEASDEYEYGLYTFWCPVCDYDFKKNAFPPFNIIEG